MKCENCNNDHDGSYGSGRFCCAKCARGFSTKLKRKEINVKVSEKLKGIKPKNPHIFTDEERKRGQKKGSKTGIHKAILQNKINYESLILLLPYDELGRKGLRDRILKEQNGLCVKCNNKNEWQGELLVFHLDHIDGNHNNNNRENLRMICPNCHSQTKNYTARNISDENKIKMKNVILQNRMKLSKPKYTNKKIIEFMAV